MVTLPHSQSHIWSHHFPQRTPAPSGLRGMPEFTPSCWSHPGTPVVTPRNTCGHAYSHPGTPVCGHTQSHFWYHLWLHPGARAVTHTHTHSSLYVVTPSHTFGVTCGYTQSHLWSHLWLHPVTLVVSPVVTPSHTCGLTCSPHSCRRMPRTGCAWWPCTSARPGGGPATPSASTWRL